MMTRKSTKTALLMRAFNNSSFAIAFFVLIFLFSCGSGDTGNRENQDAVLKQPTADTDTTRRAGGDGNAFISDSLYTLYIENNSSNSDLGKLLQNQSTKKLVFQFYRDSAGYLGLLIFPYKSNGKEIEPSQVIEAQRSNIVNDSLPGGKISLGDLQVADEPGGRKIVDTLVKHVYGKPQYSSSWKFIWLVPKINSETVGSISRQYVIYQIMRDSVQPKAITAFAAAPIGEANPSPPRNTVTN